MTWKITLELDCNQGQAILAYNALTEWAHTGDSTRLDDRWLDIAVDRMSPSVSLEPHHPDDDLDSASWMLRRLGFDTAAEAVQAARRNLNPTDPPNVTRLATEQRLAARRRVDTHQARGGRIL